MYSTRAVLLQSARQREFSLRLSEPARMRQKQRGYLRILEKVLAIHVADRDRLAKRLTDRS
jgi:hypothetical protein